ncbi:MAG: DUF2975 domain-containing protein [Bryobacteraceae bacterium]
MSDGNSNRIKLKRQARLFGIWATLAAAVTLAGVGGQIVSAAAPLWKGGRVSETLLKIGAQAILSTPALFYLWGLMRARHVFRRLGGGDLFSLENSQGLVAIGRALLIGSVWAMAAQGLTPYNPQDVLSPIGLGAGDLALAALGVALMMIGRVMSAAVDLKAENDSFV